jgi:hypothetical protein
MTCSLPSLNMPGLLRTDVPTCITTTSSPHISTEILQPPGSLPSERKYALADGVTTVPPNRPPQPWYCCQCTYGRATLADGCSLLEDITDCSDQKKPLLMAGCTHAMPRPARAVITSAAIDVTGLALAMMAAMPISHYQPKRSQHDPSCPLVSAFSVST